MTELPRRIRFEQLVPAEQAILAAMRAVEAMGADALLTEAAILLDKAKDKVADYVDAKLLVSEEKRAPVQHDHGWPRKGKKPPGTIAWEEHLEAWRAYDKKYHCDQSAERIAERGGFGYEELIMFLGHEPKTWRERT